MRLGCYHNEQLLGVMPVHKHAMHMTLPVPEHDPHLS